MNSPAEPGNGEAVAPARAAATNWHAADAATAYARLESVDAGLTQAGAEQRLRRFGPNILPEKPPPTLWQIFARQFASPLIYILGIAAIVSIFIGDVTDASFIAVVLLLNAAIGGYQEWKAERSAQALRKLLQIRAAVVRDGEVREINAEELVPGDVVWLESGNRVPADLRLLMAHGFEVDESLLTGESLAVRKDSAWLGKPETVVADRQNIAHAGSVVVRGRARGLVVATGSHTMVGQLARDVMEAVHGAPPLVTRMAKFSKVVAIIVVIAAAVVGLIGVVLQGRGIGEMFMFAVALAVAAIPEGLPAAMTVALAVATVRMARRGVIVRRLAAVEGLGSCTLIASDKTGTLTVNELTVREIALPGRPPLNLTGEGFAPEGAIVLNNEPVMANDDDLLRDFLRTAALCNEADLHQRNQGWTWHGDPTDIALLAAAHKGGILRPTLLSQHPQINQIPFEPEHRYAATFHRDGERTLVCVKGAPERILSMCRWKSEAEKAQARELATQMAQRGLRVLGHADGFVQNIDESSTPPEPRDLRFLGFAGMIDPLRPQVRHAIRSCHEAGIGVCMITGDHPVTALAISRELGLADSPEQVVAGGEIEGKSSSQLAELVRTTRVFARVSPRQKLELVEAAQVAGHFVAVTGDGVNDAPALRQANIGVAMGRSGTDVAREAAELVISDDNFATIVAGVEEGRVAYSNIRKVVAQLISTGGAEVLLVGSAIALGFPLPLLAVQLLWLNLVTNGIQGVALAFEPNEGDVLKRRPRQPSESIFNRLMIERTVVASLTMAIMGLLTFWYTLGGSDDEQAVAEARNILLLLMVLFENVHLGNNRSETKSALTLSPFRSPFLLSGALAAFSIHVIAMHLPFMQTILRTGPVTLTTWAALGCIALTVFIAIEIQKWTWRRRSDGRW